MTVTRVEVWIDGGQRRVAMGTDSWEHRITPSDFTPGSHTVNAQSFDLAGNPSVVKSVTFNVVGSVSVPITITSPVDFSQHASGAQLTVSGTAAPGSGATSVTKVDSTDPNNSTTLCTGTTSWSKAISMPTTVGTYVWRFKATDNLNQTGVTTLTLSVQAGVGPVITITKPTPGQEVTGSAVPVEGFIDVALGLTASSVTAQLGSGPLFPLAISGQVATRVVVTSPIDASSFAVGASIPVVGTFTMDRFRTIAQFTVKLATLAEVNVTNAASGAWSINVPTTGLASGSHTMTTILTDSEGFTSSDTTLINITGATTSQVGKAFRAVWTVNIKVDEPPTGETVTIAAQGDMCGHTGGNCAKPAALFVADTNVKKIIHVGDLAYNSGTTTEFNTHYDPVYKTVLGKVLPAPGNHEYKTPSASGYFAYWNQVKTALGLTSSPATPNGKSYYMVNIGSWVYISLDPYVGSAEDTAQQNWLDQQLAGPARGRPIVAGWHPQRWAPGCSGKTSNESNTAPYWDKLQAAKCELLLVGHAHHYHRTKPMAPGNSPVPASTGGIVQITVGNGGAGVEGSNCTESWAVKSSNTHGALILTLRPDGYQAIAKGVGGATIDTIPFTAHYK